MRWPCRSFRTRFPAHAPHAGTREGRGEGRVGFGMLISCPGRARPARLGTVRLHVVGGEERVARTRVDVPLPLHGQPPRFEGRARHTTRSAERNRTARCPLPQGGRHGPMRRQLNAAPWPRSCSWPWPTPCCAPSSSSSHGASRMFLLFGHPSCQPRTRWRSAPALITRVVVRTVLACALNQRPKRRQPTGRCGAVADHGLPLRWRCADFMLSTQGVMCFLRGSGTHAPHFL